ncbi:hypothetical protein FQA39_LY08933 [Lamprigera yunnana]|nr:hypothetical protein FQA39_LY08933 [Lamprigera yunnana]
MENTGRSDMDHSQNAEFSSVPQPESGMVLQDTEMEEDEARSEATFCFKLTQFSKLKDAVFSPTCYIRNLPWKIKVLSRYRIIQNRGVQKSLGFFLQCNGESDSSSWSCNAVAELRLLSVKSDTEAFTKKIEHLFCSKKNYCGYNNFMAWSDVLDMEKGYIQNDTITLEVHVVADAPHDIPWDSGKHTELAPITEQLENMRKTKLGFEKTKQPLEAEKVDFASELGNVGVRRCKQAESQLVEIQLKLVEVERNRAELEEKIQKLQLESKSITLQLEEAELKASAALKSRQTIESQFNETQAAVEEEKRSQEKQLALLIIQLAEAKKKAKEEAEQAATLEALKKKMSKETETFQRQLIELMTANDKLKKEFPNKLYNPQPNTPRVIAIVDGTYSFIHKSSNFRALQLMYDVHKGQHLVKPHLIVAPDGYILAIQCSYFCDSWNNDAAILQNEFEIDAERIRQ